MLKYYKIARNYNFQMNLEMKMKQNCYTFITEKSSTILENAFRQLKCLAIDMTGITLFLVENEIRN